MDFIPTTRRNPTIHLVPEFLNAENVLCPNDLPLRYFYFVTLYILLYIIIHIYSIYIVNNNHIIIIQYNNRYNSAII